ncbi:hypothetical protein [Vibrio phage vB_pir03]|nr:hypothetical protein [Vibrio phage vB_pir03]
MENIHVLFPFFTGQLQTELYFQTLMAFVALFLLFTTPFSGANRKLQSASKTCSAIGCLILVVLLAYLCGFGIFEYILPGKTGGIMGFLLGYIAMLEMMIQAAHKSKIRGMFVSMRLMVIAKRLTIALAIGTIFYVQCYQV